MGDAERSDGGYLDAALRRGALVNAFGVVAKLAFPILFLVVTWTLGPEVTGVFSLAFFAGELLRGFVVGGYMDGVTLYTSRSLREPSHAAPTRVIGASLGTTAWLSTVVMSGTWLLVEWSVEDVFPEYDGLEPALVYIAWSLPASAVLNVALAATKARMHMHYEVLVNGLARPVGLTVCAVVAAWTDTGLPGLMAGYFVTHLLLALLALWVLGRCFSLRAVFKGLRGESVGALHRFAIPQSFNLTLNNYQTRVDAWVLGILATPPTLLAFYTTGALLASALREIRIVFSSSLAPVAARYHAAGEHGALEETLNRISRWTTALVIPCIFTLIFFRSEIFVAIDEAYTGDSTFFLVLLSAPFATCAVGLPGNLLSYCGHSGWSLANVIVVSVVNTVLNFLLIPSMGLLGAAVGTAAATVLLNLMQNAELASLEGIRLRFTELTQPWAGLVVLTALTAAVWDPADMAIGWRALLFLSGLGLYVAVLRGLGMPEVRRGAGEVGDPSGM